MVCAIIRACSFVVLLGAIRRETSIVTGGGTLHFGITADLTANMSKPMDFREAKNNAGPMLHNLEIEGKKERRKKRQAKANREGTFFGKNGMLHLTSPGLPNCAANGKPEKENCRCGSNKELCGAGLVCEITTTFDLEKGNAIETGAVRKPKGYKRNLLPTVRRGHEATVEALGRDASYSDGEEILDHVVFRARQRKKVVFRVLKAKFTDENRIGKFHARVKLIKKDGSEQNIESIRAVDAQYMAVEWNYACKGRPYVSTDTLSIKVCSSRRACVGKGVIPVKDFFSKSENEDEAIGTLQAVALVSERRRQEPKKIGVLFVQALMVSQMKEKISKLTRVDPELFESPVKELGVSGGTASFYSLRLRGLMKSPTFYIGKDLSRASDEIEFYDATKDVRHTSCGAAFAPLLDFALEYLGVVKCHIASAPDWSPPKDLIVMRNLFDGAKGLRLLDLKIGQTTASLNWKGKSRFGKWQQDILDGITNSQVEGYRLEGFDGIPEVLRTMRTQFDKREVDKKERRLRYQSMTASSIFAFFLALAQPDRDDQEEKLSPTEYAEIVQSEICTRLLRLSIACRLAPAPQKWVGSSVALGFDATQLPLRSKLEKDIREDVRVKLFDWGRSELTTVLQWDALTDDEKENRARYWGYYISAIDRLAYEASRTHYHRYCNMQEWKVQGHVFDYDEEDADSFLGKLEIPLTPTNGSVTAKLFETSGEDGQGTLTYSVAWRDYPVESRLKGAWRVNLVRAQNLRSQMLKSTNPYVLLRATSVDRKHTFEQRTIVIAGNSNPEWGEVLEVPVAKRSQSSSGEHCHLFEQTVSQRLIQESTELVTLMVQPLDIRNSLSQWKYLIDLAAVDASKNVQGFAQWP